MSSEKIFKDNIKIVWSFVNKNMYIFPNHMDRDDIFQEMSIAFFNAICNYDESKGELSTYANSVMRGYMLNLKRGGDSIVKINRGAKELYNKYLKLTKKEGLTDREAKERIEKEGFKKGLDISDLEFAIVAMRGVKSMEEPVFKDSKSEGEELMVMDTIKSEVDVEESFVDDMSFIEKMRILNGNTSDKVCEVFTRRFVFGEEGSQIAYDWDVTPTYISQCYREALLYLKYINYYMNGAIMPEEFKKAVKKIKSMPRTKRRPNVKCLGEI